MTYREIIENHASYSKTNMKNRRFTESETLVYVTPWNNHGYDIAKWFHKFTLVSPVWFQLKMEGVGFKVHGTHDVDQGWVEEVRATGAKVVPRIIVEIRPDVLKNLLSDEDSIKVRKFLNVLI
jgi:chitinase domain-containing protein 1